MRPFRRLKVNKLIAQHGPEMPMTILLLTDDPGWISRLSRKTVYRLVTNHLGIWGKWPQQGSAKRRPSIFGQSVVSKRNRIRGAILLVELAERTDMLEVACGKCARFAGSK